MYYRIYIRHLYNFINQWHPNKFNKKEKKSPLLTLAINFVKLLLPATTREKKKFFISEVQRATQNSFSS